jgi:hypothetical protein
MELAKQLLRLVVEMDVRDAAGFLTAEEVEQGIDRAAHGQDARQPAAGVQ